MKLVVIEGLDGAGKSTQIELLRNHLVESKGVKCEHLHFPRTEAPYFGELIARFLRGEFGSVGEVDPYLVAMIYAGDRRDAAEQIRRWLDEGKMVILDRYTYSNVAYQCAKTESKESRQRLREWILNLEFRHFKIPQPDINIFLDVPLIFTEQKLKAIREGEERSYLNGKSDIHEADIRFQHKVRDVYLETAKADSLLTVINCCDESGAMQSPGVISERIISTIYS